VLKCRLKEHSFNDWERHLCIISYVAFVYRTSTSTTRQFWTRRRFRDGSKTCDHDLIFHFVRDFLLYIVKQKVPSTYYQGLKFMCILKIQAFLSELFSMSSIKMTMRKIHIWCHWGKISLVFHSWNMYTFKCYDINDVYESLRFCFCQRVQTHGIQLYKTIVELCISFKRSR